MGRKVLITIRDREIPILDEQTERGLLYTLPDQLPITAEHLNFE